MWVFSGKIISRVNSLTYLTQPPFRLCNHAAPNPEKLLCQSRYGRFLPELWWAHDGRAGGVQVARGLFPLMAGAPSQRGGEHPWGQRPQGLEGGPLGRRGALRRAATQSWRQRGHSWVDVHPWIVDLSPTIQSHLLHMNPPSSSFCWALQKKWVPRTESFMQLLESQHISQVKSSHKGSGNNTPILKLQSSSSCAHWSSHSLFYLFLSCTARRFAERKCATCVTKSSSSCNPGVRLQPRSHGGISTRPVSL